MGIAESTYDDVNREYRKGVGEIQEDTIGDEEDGLEVIGV